ncbi:hypothetical protein C8F01DRAFT_1250428 [Mycena amicta]|nr:hypothetical protein C8F01DRAFT_1250428 [Mycena amicta]
MPRVPATKTRTQAGTNRGPGAGDNPGLTFSARSTRSGAQFSPYELVLDDIDLPSLLLQRIGQQDALGEHEDPEIVVRSGLPLPDDEPAICAQPATIAARPAPIPIQSTPNPPSSPSLSAAANAKRKKKAKRPDQRAKAQAASSTPSLKQIAVKHARAAIQQQVRLGSDAAELPHTVPAWTGHPHPASRPACTPPLLELDAQVLEGREYTQEEVDKISKAHGLRYLRWNGRESIPIVDLRRRLVALLAGQPSGENWAGIVESAGRALEERVSRLKLSKGDLHHRRAQDSFPALARGVSHGGGQTQPGELLVSGANKKVTDELLAHDAFHKIVMFTTSVFAMWMPALCGAYTAAKTTFAKSMPRLRWAFAAGVFAACTWNFVTTVCAPHVDFANLAWGWCAITALGQFNADLGGHLIRWDLRLIIRFPPGATIFIPSALLKHSNTPIQKGETRSSFVQYSAGGLFRWIDQDFKTKVEFERTASDEQLEAARARAETRWEDGVGHFTNIDHLFLQ